jgi:Domain of unknown function (DUF1127)
MLVAILNFLRAWRRYNASLKELYQLGDRELADIGITRSGYSAHRMGQFPARKFLNKSARSGGHFLLSTGISFLHSGRGRCGCT